VHQVLDIIPPRAMQERTPLVEPQPALIVQPVRTALIQLSSLRDVHQDTSLNKLLQTALFVQQEARVLIHLKLRKNVEWERMPSPEVSLARLAQEV